MVVNVSRFAVNCFLRIMFTITVNTLVDAYTFYVKLHEFVTHQYVQVAFRFQHV